MSKHITDQHITPVTFTSTTLPSDIKSYLETMFRVDKQVHLDREPNIITNFLTSKIADLGYGVGSEMITEYYHYRVNGIKESPLGWHTDNEGHIDDCWTAVLYYHKDKTIKGGNFHAFINGNDVKFRVTADRNGGAQLAIFDGKTLEHRVSDMEGVGVRQSVSFLSRRVISRRKIGYK